MRLVEEALAFGAEGMRYYYTLGNLLVKNFHNENVCALNFFFCRLKLPTKYIFLIIHWRKYLAN